MKDIILFDLDGTLTDPGVGITTSVQYALHYYGIEIEDRTTLNTFIGPPLHESFMKYFGFDEATALEAVEKYRKYFRDRGIFENEVYDGIPALLKKLKGAGKTLIMATSKPECFAVRIAEHFGIDTYFDCICGSELDGTRLDKAEVINCALERLGITDRNACVMIGDRLHDIKGGKKCSMATIGVLYGYGSREELEDAGADLIAADVASLETMII